MNLPNCENFDKLFKSVLIHKTIPRYYVDILIIHTQQVPTSIKKIFARINTKQCTISTIGSIETCFYSILQNRELFVIRIGLQSTIWIRKAQAFLIGRLIPIQLIKSLHKIYTLPGQFFFTFFMCVKYRARSSTYQNLDETQTKLGQTSDKNSYFHETLIGNW